MKLLNNIVRFRKDEDGAVTVDWVVLTAGIVAVVVGLVALLAEPLSNVVDSITDGIESAGGEGG